MLGLLARERIIAPASFNRWLVPPASIAIHLCIGSVYAWSIYNPALIRVFGVVTPAAEDWLLSDVVWIFTVAIVFLGPLCRARRQVARGRRPAHGRHRRGGLLGRRLSDRRARHLLARAVARVSRLRRDRRLRLRLGLRVARQHADSVVPRPPRHGSRNGHHGLRRRCDHRRAAETVLHPHVLRATGVSRNGRPSVARHRRRPAFRRRRRAAARGRRRRRPTTSAA